MRPRTTWLLFATACAMVVAVMIGASWALLRLEASRVATEEEALREELVRLSLWRMDSVITPLLAREIAEAGLDVGDEPLPTGVRARFVIHPGGRADAVGPIDGDTHGALLAMIAAQSPADTLVAVDDATRQVAGSYLTAKRGIGAEQGQSQSARNLWEYSKRVASVQDNFYNSSLGNPTFGGQASDGYRGGEGTTDVPVAILEMMRPLWWGSELVMVRRVRTAAGERIDGSWLDWPAVRDILRGEIIDLLPAATLRVDAADATGDDARRLASLPVVLEPGVVPGPSGADGGPLPIAIGAAWAFVLVAVGAVAVLLRGSLALSDRRAAFVSAVTHELRTPLTTFRMYTEMLSDGMVEQDKRERYLSTLRREAERLGQLVENVLSYARIEADQGGRVRGGPNAEVMTVDHVLERCTDRLVERCRTAGLELRVALDDDVGAARLRIDVVATEQILFNLVDNAAKYGASEAHPIIELRIAASGDHVTLAVRDFGPGVPPGERRRVFEPFAKGERHAAGTKPGVGLGLALSRRLAQQMGGTLELRDAEHGAAFVLSLPAA